MEISNLNLKSMKPGENDTKKSSWETLTLRENRKKLKVCKGSKQSAENTSKGNLQGNAKIYWQALRASPSGSVVENLPAMQKMWV